MTVWFDLIKATAGVNEMFQCSRYDQYLSKVLKSKIQTDDTRSYHGEGEVAFTENLADTRQDTNILHIHFISLRRKLLK